MRILSVLIVFFVLSGCVLAEIYNSQTMVVVAGAIRQDVNDPTKWCWINDKNHTPTGVDRDLCHKAKDGKITINYGIEYKKVITLMVGADETYVSNLNMNVGASVGLSLSIIEMTTNGVKAYPEYNLGYAAGNIWIYGVMESF
jgi:uncharacterized protein YceK